MTKMAVNLFSRTSFYKDSAVTDGDETVKDYHDRGRWWLHTIRNTPNPGKYHTPTFLEEAQNVPVQKTYGFRSSGRTTNADPSKTGGVLLPGAYHVRDFVEEASSKQQSFGFKDSKRLNLNNATKEVYCGHVGPGYYDVISEKRNQPSKGNTPCFASKSKRFPTIHFKPKEGPSPCQYEMKQKVTTIKSMPMSAFKSNTPRFVTAHLLKTPGPGAYTKLSYKPKSSNVNNLGRYHGLFFPCGPGA